MLKDFYDFFYWASQIKAHGNQYFHISVLKAYIKEYENNISSNIYKEYLAYKKEQSNNG